MSLNVDALQTKTYFDFEATDGQFLSSLWDPVVGPRPAAPSRGDDPPLAAKQNLTSIGLGGRLSIIDDRVQLLLDVREQGIEPKGYDCASGELNEDQDDRRASPSVALLLRPLPPCPSRPAMPRGWPKVRPSR